MTRQAVWPRELIERRSAAARLESRIRELARQATGHHSEEAARLRAERAALPCPHWDVAPAGDGTDDWMCETCRERIAPAWVPLGEQEAQLRRAGTRPTP